MSKKQLPSLNLSGITDKPTLGALRQIKEIIDVWAGRRGDSLDQAVTLRELSGAGVVEVQRGGSSSVRIRPSQQGNNPAPQYAPPVALTDLAASGGLASVMLSWQGVNQPNYLHTEIWRATVNDLGQAVRHATAVVASATDYIGNAGAYWYWVRPIGRDGRPGPFNAVAGTYAETSEEPSYIKEVLEGQVSKALLATELNTRIDLIDAPDTGLLSRVADHSNRVLELEEFAEDAERDIEANASAVAGIGARVTETEKGIEAHAVRLTGLDTTVGQNSASIKTVEESVATEASARAKAIGEVTSTLDGLSTTVQTQAESIDGLNAKYTVKIDANGHVTGYGLAVEDNEGAPTSSFTIVSDSFSLVLPGRVDNPVVPFTSGLVNGEYKFLLSGDVVFNGRVNISQLDSGVLADNTALTVGDDSLIIAGASANGPGSITIAGPGGTQMNDYVFMSNRQLQFFRYINGVGHVPSKALKRRESGVANNGQTVVLPGYWESPPEILVSPNRLPTYLARYAGQDQAWSFRADNMTNLGNGKYSFRALAELQLGAAGGSGPVGYTNGGSAADHWHSALVTTPENTTAITAHVRFSSSRGTGTSPNYYHRRVRWRIAYGTTPGSITNYTGYHTTTLGASLGEVVDALAISGLASRVWYFRIECIAEDAGGTFASGSTQYHYHYEEKTAAGPVNVESTSGSKSVTLDLGALSLPAGYTVYDVQYSGEVAYYVSSSYTIQAPNGQALATAPRLYQLVYASVHGIQTRGDLYLNNWAAVSEGANSYNRNFFTGTAYASGNSRARVALRNAKAKIYASKPVENSTTPSNVFELTHYDYSLSSAQVIAEGTLNWVAVGE